MEAKNKIVKYSLIIWAFFLITFYSALAQAATHYVSPSGSASWANSTSIATPCSLATARSNASAGDTVYFRAGTYSNGYLTTSNSGTNGSPIILQAYNSENVTIDGNSSQSYVFNLSNRSYITIGGTTAGSGFTFQNYTSVWYFAATNSSLQHDIIIQNCTMTGGGISVEKIDNIQILDNTIDVSSAGLGGINFGGSATNKLTNSRIEGNTIIGGNNPAGDGLTLHVGHGLEDIGDHHLIKDNVVHGFGENNYDITSGNYIVLDGNEGYDAHGPGYSMGSSSGSSLAYVRVVNNIEHDEHNDWAEHIYLGSDIAGPVQILRNQFYGKAEHDIQAYTGEATGADKIRIFHNTFDSRDLADPYGLHFQAPVSDINVKNNIFYTDVYAINWATPGAADMLSDYNLYWHTADSPGVDLWYETYKTLAAIRTNYNRETNSLESDPLLVNPGSADYTITSSSPAHDAGGWLTQINESTGSGTVFNVDDSLWFYDGWGITGETGDVIKTENGETARITSVNYTTHEITVDKSISWTNGEGIGLYYQGTKPDIGAKEFSSDNGFPSSPEGLTIKVN